MTKHTPSSKKKGKPAVPSHRWAHAHRLKPHRPSNRREWWLAGILLLTNVYVFTGIYFYGQIYLNKHTNLITRAVRFYPFPAARVGTTLIPLSRYWRDVQAINQYINVSNTADKYAQIPVETQVLERLERAAAVRRLAHRYNVTVTKKEVNDAYDAASQGEQGLIERNLKQYYNFAPADFKVWIAESLLERKVSESVVIRRNVSHIMISVDASASAEDVERARLRLEGVKNLISGGMTFADAAKQESNDAGSRDQGGSLGWISRGGSTPLIDQQFEDAVFSAPLNEITGPVRSSRGWHLILVSEQTGQLDISLEQLIAQELTQAGVVTYIQ